MFFLFFILNVCFFFCMELGCFFECCVYFCFILFEQNVLSDLGTTSAVNLLSFVPITTSQTPFDPKSSTGLISNTPSHSPYNSFSYSYESDTIQTESRPLNAAQSNILLMPTDTLCQHNAQ